MKTQTIPTYEVRVICIKMNNALGAAIDAIAAMRGAYTELNALWAKSVYPPKSARAKKKATKPRRR